LSDTRPSASTTVAVLWLVVITEILSPIPLALSAGAIYVLVARPAWFLDVVRDLYPEALD